MVKTTKKWELESHKDIKDLIDVAAASDAVFDLATPLICLLQGGGAAIFRHFGTRRILARI
ncbi:MAG: hypothetical protein VW492_12635 [Deltaproteobacteria bacterium]